jgi:Mrp family chromosome partitioning ATPase/predicted Fe-Mo cluster-binding NifX family protein
MIDSGCSCESINCGSSCSPGKTNTIHDFIEKTHELNSIKRVIGVASGKGGVGKSLITSVLSVLMRRKGYKVGILDADITGPSIPKLFGITKKAEGCEFGIYPQRSHNDISIMSVNLLLEKDDSPVIWRGPIIAGTVKQFWTDVIWGDIDYLFLDMPPGTGDVPLTVFQSIPIDGIVIVTSPQDLVSLIVKKAYNMAKSMNVPILGIVENMSFLKCPDCNKEIKLFGESKIDAVVQDLGTKVLGKMPIDPKIAELCDNGEIEKFDNEYLTDAVQYIENILSFNREEKFVMKIAIATEGTNISAHFGKCENFTIAEIQNSNVKNKNIVNTLGNQHGLLPAFLASHNVNLVITGGMGEGARQNLISKGIEIITGASGDIDEVINSFLSGGLKSSNTGCVSHEHSHGHNNGESGCNCGHH